MWFVLAMVLAGSLAAQPVLLHERFSVRLPDDAAKGRTQARWRACFSGDGRYFAVCGDATTQVYDPHGALVMRLPPGVCMPGRGATILRQGEGPGGRGEVWDLDARACVHAFDLRKPDTWRADSRCGPAPGIVVEAKAGWWLGTSRGESLVVVRAGALAGEFWLTPLWHEGSGRLVFRDRGPACLTFMELEAHPWISFDVRKNVAHPGEVPPTPLADLVPGTPLVVTLATHTDPASLVWRDVATLQQVATEPCAAAATGIRWLAALSRTSLLLWRSGRLVHLDLAAGSTRTLLDGAHEDVVPVLDPGRRLLAVPEDGVRVFAVD